MTTFRVGALDSRHRSRLAEILTATGAFTTDEVAIALELFDETFERGESRLEGRADVDKELSRAGNQPPRPSTLEPRPSSYEFLGLFDENDVLAGYACYGPTPGTDGTFDLYWIAVHPAVQGGGEGSRLLAEVERRLRGRNGRLLVVETSSRIAYAPTRRFYEGRGYKEVARVTDFYAPADHLVIYVKRFAEAGAASAVQSPITHRLARSASP
jgi:ribosomal protein S18 acetylase RimI-like enzyme